MPNEDKDNLTNPSHPVHGGFYGNLDQIKEQAKALVDKEKQDRDNYAARIGSTKGFK